MAKSASRYTFFQVFESTHNSTLMGSESTPLNSSKTYHWCGIPSSAESGIVLAYSSKNQLDYQDDYGAVIWYTYDVSFTCTKFKRLTRHTNRFMWMLEYKRATCALNSWCAGSSKTCRSRLLLVFLSPRITLSTLCVTLRVCIVVQYTMNYTHLATDPLCIFAVSYCILSMQIADILMITFWPTRKCR